MKSRPSWYVTANTYFQKLLKANINPVSFIGRNNHNPYSNIPPCKDSTAELEVEEDPAKYCLQCNQLNAYCHRVVYQDFIKKKLFSKYMNRITKPTYDEVKAEMRIAYNQKREVEYHKEFGFIDNENVELPLCLIGYSFDLVNLSNKLQKLQRSILKPEKVYASVSQLNA